MITCVSCGYKGADDNFKNNKCPYCAETLTEADIHISDDVKQRLAFAHSLRRIGKFSDAKKEFNNILAMNSKAKGSDSSTVVNKSELKAAALGYFLSLYEVYDYRWNGTRSSVEYCNCTSTSLSPIDNSNFWRIVSSSDNFSYKILCAAIEQKRKHNIEIKGSIPKYHAAVICDQSNEQDMEMANKIYENLSSKSDVFFAPITLSDIPIDEREFYIYQAIRNPNNVRLMFVIYSQPFDFQYTNKVYQADIVRQCEDFAKTHTKDELYSIILGNGEPSDDMNEISIKKLNCRVVDSGASERISGALMKIIANHISDKNQEIIWNTEGRLLPLNGAAFSPKVSPK